MGSSQLLSCCWAYGQRGVGHSHDAARPSSRCMCADCGFRLAVTYALPLPISMFGGRLERQSVTGGRVIVD